MSQITDFYPSWLGGNSFGVTSSTPLVPNSKVFTPLDISDCSIWFNCNDVSTMDRSDTGVVLAIDNLGYAGSAALKATTEDVTVVQDVNNLNCLNMPGGAFLQFTMTLPYQSRTTFIVYKLTYDISGAAYPYANFYAGSQEYEGLGIAAWMNNGSYRWQMAVGGIDFALDGVSADYPPYNVAQAASFRKDYDTPANDFVRINGGPNINIYSTLSQFLTGEDTYTMNGSPGDTSMVLCEIIEYGRALSDADVTLVHNYIQAKWFPPTP